MVGRGGIRKGLAGLQGGPESVRERGAYHCGCAGGT